MLWSHGGEGSTGSLCSQVSQCSAGFSTKKWKAPKKWEARVFLPSLPLVPPQQWLLCPLKVSIFCGFWFHQALSWDITASSFHPFSLGVWIPAAANFWVTFCILLLSFFWHLWKRFLQQIPSDLNRVLPLSRLDFKWYFQGRMLGTTVWHLELMWLHRYNKGMATTGGRRSWHLPVQHPQCAGNCAGYKNLVRTKTYTTSNSQRIIIWVTKKLLYNSELL